MMKQAVNSPWEMQTTNIPDPWKAWLLHSGSFMQRLAIKGAIDAQVRVLQESWQLPMLEERSVLSMDFRIHGWAREVLILSEGKTWMFARTLIPYLTLVGQGRKLAHLKNRPLGSVLFKDPTMRRSDFEIAYLQPGVEWHSKAVEATGCILSDLWARRSLFTLQDKPLLLTEVFLPDIAML
jgi:chorismate--pyruvate lyase